MPKSKILKTLSVKDIKDHVNSFGYMSSIERDINRINKNSEVFTPVSYVNKILDTYPQEVFSNPNKTFCDATGCGDGEWLGQVLIRKVENGIDFETALSTIYGVELCADNTKLCKERLLCGQEHLRHIVDQNIVCADSLRYHFRFDGTDPYKSEQDVHNETLFEIS